MSAMPGLGDGKGEGVLAEGINTVGGGSSLLVVSLVLKLSLECLEIGLHLFINSLELLVLSQQLLDIGVGGGS